MVMLSAIACDRYGFMLNKQRFVFTLYVQIGASRILQAIAAFTHKKAASAS